MKRTLLMSGADFMTAFMKTVGGMIPDFTLDQLEIFTLKPWRDGWKIALDPKLEGMAAMFDKALK
jgi:hypothetical protein